jgi:hypothetical protein
MSGEVMFLDDRQVGSRWYENIVDEALGCRGGEKKTGGRFYTVNGAFPCAGLFFVMGGCTSCPTPQVSCNQPTIHEQVLRGI